MSIDAQREELYPLRIAVKLAPRSSRTGKTLHPSVLLRWAKRGLLAADRSRVYLEVLKAGSTLATSREALQRLFDELTRRVDLPHPSYIPASHGGPSVAGEAQRSFAERELAIFDPVSAFIDGSMNSEPRLRRALSALATLAEQQDIAVVLVRHLNKSGGTNVLYRGVGSIALTAVARSTLLVGPEPADPSRRVLASAKHSLCGEAPSLAFKPVPHGEGLVIEWVSETHCSAEDLLQEAGQRAASQLHDAIYVLY